MLNIKKLETYRKALNVAPIIISIILIVLTGLSGATLFYSVRDESIRTLYKQNRSVVNEIECRLTLIAALVENNAAVMRRPVVCDEMLRDIFTHQKRTVDDIAMVYAGFPDGRTLTGYAGEAEGVYAPFQPWYIAAAKNPGELVFIRPYFDADTGQFVFSAARTIGDDISLGVVAISIAVEQLTNEIAEPGNEYGSFSYILDSDGTIIFHHYPRFAPDDYSEFRNIKEVDGGRYAGLFDAVSNQGFYECGGALHVGAQIEATGWFLINRIPTAHIIAGVTPVVFSVAVTSLLAIITITATWLLLWRSNKALKREYEASELNRVLIETAPFACIVWSEDGKMIACNQQAATLHGAVSKDELIEMYPKLIPQRQPCGTPSDRFVYENLKKSFREGRNVFEVTRMKLDGEALPLLATHLRANMNGKAVVLSYAKDLTEEQKAAEKQRIAEEKIREVNNLNRQILDAYPEYIEIWDDKNELVYCNKFTLDAMNCENIEQYKEVFWNINLERQSDGTPSKQLLNTFLEETRKKGYVRAEWSMINPKNGEETTLDSQFILIERNGRYEVMAFSVDTRDIKLRQLAEQENNEKSRFIARMSHEIRTPLNSIMGLAEIQLQKVPVNTEEEQVFNSIYNSSKVLLGIVNDILDLSKVKAGKLEIVDSRYDVSSLIADTVQINLAHIGSKRIDFNFEICEYTPESLIGDDLRIKQILNNILSNAFKYTNSGKVDFAVSSMDASDPQYVNLVLRVYDTGRGMAKELINGALGSEYTRLDAEQNRYIEGSGLGISIVKQIVDLMGGEIEVESRVSVGTAVTIIIPQKKAADQMLGLDTAKALSSLDTYKNFLKKKEVQNIVPMPYGRVLVVDDVMTNLVVVKGMLLPYKLSIETVESGFEAISLIESGKEYDIIFMDHMMVNMDGIETTKKIRDMGYNRPIIALTANAVSGMHQMFMDNGFDGFISKPVDTKALHEYLMRFIHDESKNDESKNDESNK